MNIPSILIDAQPESPNLVNGVYPPQRFRNENVDSVNVVIRSEDRISGTPYDFTVDLVTSSVFIRKIALSKVIMPLLPQVNANNKRITITHQDGPIVIDLVEGFYSVQAYVNMLEDKFTAAWLALSPLNSVVVNYDVDHRQIIITDLQNENWYFNDDCPFIRFGYNVSSFPSLPIGSPTTAFLQTSTSLQMIYSRFIIVSSKRLTDDQKGYSMVSSKGCVNIAAVLDLSSEYSASQFAASASFPGTTVTLDTLQYSPHINLLNRQKALKVVDIALFDEFFIPLDRINTSTYTFDYSIAMWFQGYL